MVCEERKDSIRAGGVMMPMEDKVFDLLLQSITELRQDIKTLNDRLLVVDRAFNERIVTVENKIAWYAGGISVLVLVLSYIAPLIVGKMV